MEVFVGAQKSLRFGNGQRQQSESYLRIPQLLSRKNVALGIFSLDVPQVPILIGVRTLKHLGMCVDFAAKKVTFKKVAPEVMIPLQESKSGHVLEIGWAEPPSLTHVFQDALSISFVSLRPDIRARLGFLQADHVMPQSSHGGEPVLGSGDSPGHVHAATCVTCFGACANPGP